MEYDIIERVSGLAASSLSVEERLREAARLMLSAIPYEACLVYLDDGRGGVRLAGRAGSRTSPSVDSYREGEGLPALVRSTGEPVAVRKLSPAGWDGLKDRGLARASYAMAVPLKGPDRFFGVIYFKSIAPVAPSRKTMRLAKLVALQVVALIRCSELLAEGLKAREDMMEVRQRLVDSGKLLALGDMASAMAHEIRNPILSVGAYASRLKRHLPPGSPGFNYLEQMAADIARIEKIMDAVARFLKDEAVELRPEDLNSIAAEALSIFSEEFTASGISVVRRLSSEPLRVLADREQMKIAFDNLMANAIQSMENGGSLSIETSLSGGFAVARLSDTGGGIDPEHLPHIFNPFFTTKKHGTGLGLSITSSIVTRHNGSIEALNEGPGAVFIIRLPYTGGKGA